MRRIAVAASVAFLMSCALSGFQGLPFVWALMTTLAFTAGWLVGDVIRWAWGRWRQRGGTQ
jgi:hypothetical protein